MIDFPIPSCSPVSPAEAMHAWARRSAPWFGAAALAFLTLGFVDGLLLRPASEWHADANRILLLHLPTVWISLATYAVVVVLSVCVIGYRNRLAALLSSALAPTGIVFALLALWSGALWERPMRGAWWDWDVRAVTGLLLLVLFLGIVATKAMIEEPRRADRAGALIALVGAANLAVLFFSMRWWDAMRRGGTPSPELPAVTPSVMIDLAFVTAGFAAYVLFAALMRVRFLIAEQEWQASAHCLLEKDR